DFLGAVRQRVSGGEGELVTDLQLDPLAGELGDTNFRTLQIPQQCDETSVLGGDFANQLGASLVLIRGAVGKVQASNVQTRKDQSFVDFRRVTGRAKGGDDFGTAYGHAQTP